MYVCVCAPACLHRERQDHQELQQRYGSVLTEMRQRTRELQVADKKLKEASRGQNMMADSTPLLAEALEQVGCGPGRGGEGRGPSRRHAAAAALYVRMDMPRAAPSPSLGVEHPCACMVHECIGPHSHCDRPSLGTTY